MLVCALLAATAMLATPASARNLGPGAGDWTSEAPEKHGLSSSALLKAANEIYLRANERYCLLIAKDGVLVHE